MKKFISQTTLCVFVLTIIFGIVITEDLEGQKVRTKTTVRKPQPAQVKDPGITKKPVILSCGHLTAVNGGERYIDLQLNGSGFGGSPNGRYIKFGSIVIPEPQTVYWYNNMIEYLMVNVNLVNYGQKYPIAIAVKDNNGVEKILSNIYYYTPLMLLANVEPKEGMPGKIIVLGESPTYSGGAFVGHFGDSKGSSRVMIRNKEAQVVSWSNKSVSVKVPDLPKGEYKVAIFRGKVCISTETIFKVKPGIKQSRPLQLETAKNSKPIKPR